MTHLPPRLLLVGLTLLGCSAGDHHRTDAATFVRLAHSSPESVSDSAYIGSVNGRAYLVRWSGMPWLLGGGEDVYSVAIDDLPPDLADRIRAGKNPWGR